MRLAFSAPIQPPRRQERLRCSGRAPAEFWFTPPRFRGVLASAIWGLAPSAMLDFLHHARQRMWQVLPLGPTGYGASPYALLSAFAGNPLLISPERLLEDESAGACGPGGCASWA